MLAAIIRRLKRDRRGAMLLEIAAGLPVIALMLTGGVELSRYILLHQKLEHVATTTADLVSRSEKVDDTDMANIFSAVKHVISPFAMGPNGVVIVSSVTDGIVDWQDRGAGTMPEASKIGTPGGTANLPAGFSLASGESVIIAEIYYDYVPWIFDFLSAERLYQRALFRPRESNSVTRL